mmetsp:Transcript_23543/g.72427  ORF Transcript_23543/g.72427 Transcript_23543/m.72427 type:complete len:229 (-) Transcript_23543:56-742(-)
MVPRVCFEMKGAHTLSDSHLASWTPPSSRQSSLARARSSRVSSSQRRLLAEMLLRRFSEEAEGARLRWDMPTRNCWEAARRSWVLSSAAGFEGWAASSRTWFMAVSRAARLTDGAARVGGLRHVGKCSAIFFHSDTFAPSGIALDSFIALDSSIALSRNDSRSTLLFLFITARFEAAAFFRPPNKASILFADDASVTALVSLLATMTFSKAARGRELHTFLLCCRRCP